MSDNQIHPQTQTTNLPETLDTDRQQKAKEYARIGRWIFAIELIFSTVYIIFWIISGLSVWLRDYVHTITTVTWLSVPLFAFFMGLPYSLISAPLDYYSGFVLPHRYGQSTQSLKDWLVDQLKSTLIGSVLGLIVLEIIYALLGIAPETWWLWTAAVLLLFSVVLSNLAPILIFPLFFKYHPLEDEALVEKLLNLAKKTGTHVQGVYAFDMSSKTVAANAALMGLGNTRRIVLGDTLLQNFSHAEIESVLAHELGHHAHNDIGWGIAVQSIITLMGLWIADGVMQWGIATFAYTGLTDPATLPLFMVAMALFGLITMPLTNIWSRWREVMADRYALQTTHNPQAFINAMTRLANQNLAEVEPPAWIEFLLHSHPSIQKRVAMAKTFQVGIKS